MTPQHNSQTAKTVTYLANRDGDVKITVTVTNKSDGTALSADITISVSPRVPVTHIVMDPASTPLNVNEKTIVTAIPSPDNATHKNIAWNTDKAAVAKIIRQGVHPGGHDNAGLPFAEIEAVGFGEAKITATALDGTGATATCIVTVKALPVYPENIIFTDGNAQSMVVGKTGILKTAIEPLGTDADKRKLYWTSDNPDVASVDYASGTITAKTVGECVITATCVTVNPNSTIGNAGVVSKECTLRVTKSANPVTGISINQETLTVTVGKTLPLVATLNPINASNKTIDWISSDITVVSVPATSSSGGTVTIKGVTVSKKDANGDYIPTIITAQSREEPGEKVTCEVIVIPVPATPATELKLNPQTAVLVVGGTVTPKATLQPKDATVKTVSWNSSDPLIAEVDTSGKVLARNPGIVTITATPDGATDPAVRDTCVINVVGLNQTEATLKTTQASTLEVEHLPAGMTVAWATSKVSVANVSAKSGRAVTVTAGAAGEATITATVKNGTSTVATLKAVITVTGDADLIHYYIDGKANVPFKVADFTAIATKTTGNALNFVKFHSLPSAAEGTLYVNFDKAGEARVSTTGFYYNTAGTPKISEISFVPASSFVGPVNLHYTATDAKGNSYTGMVRVSVSDATGDIKYTTAKNTPVSFRGEDFNDFCQEKTGIALNSLKFTPPPSAAGDLYASYDNSSGKVTGQKVTATQEYYYSNLPGISDLSFVPAKDFVGSVDIKFTGRDKQTGFVSGTVRVTVGRSSNADIEYIIAKNEVLRFDLKDFNDFSKLNSESTINYVQFTLPHELKGTLYYEYKDKNRYESEVSASKRYSRAASPHLDDVYFVPAHNFEGLVAIPFTGKSNSGAELSGTIAILVGNAMGDISYTAGINVPIQLQSKDFNDFSNLETKLNLSTVQFTLPKPTEGVLYYQYGRSGEKTVDTGTFYNRTTVPRIDDITFIPAKDFKGTIEFAFTARSMDGKTIPGVVALTYSDGAAGIPIVRYETTYRPVTFSGADFTAANTKRGGEALRSVQFALPPTLVGRLYENYKDHNNNDGLVDEKTVYAPGDLSKITLVPRAGNTGTIAIPYDAVDEKGLHYSGYVEITVSPTITSRFRDMNGHMWSMASVEFLFEAGVVKGTSATTYSPGNYISRGDFILMLYRASDFRGSTGTNFRDVPAGSYYADAIGAARAAGIALGDTNGYFYPAAALTREDAMVLVCRTLENTGRALPKASANYLDGFGDGYRVSPYAKADVAAMVQAALILGDEHKNLKPLAPIERAEMAMILHRILT